MKQQSDQSNKQKLVLNKERIAQLTEREMESIVGGDGSTLHDFTCNWCTSDYGTPNPNIYAYNGGVYGSYEWGPGGGVHGGYSGGSYTISVHIYF